MAKHAAICSGKEQKERETQRQYEDALHRERCNRQRVEEVHSADLKHALETTERKNDKAWGKVCARLQSQIGLLQSQVAQYELQRISQDKQWTVKEENFERKASVQQAEIKVTAKLSCSSTIFIL